MSQTAQRAPRSHGLLPRGHECTLDMQVGPRADEDPNYSSSQNEALSAARDWMASFDISSVDIQRAENDWLRHLQRIWVGNPNTADGSWSVAALSQKFWGDELEKYAVMNAATSRLAGYLEDRGFELRSLNSGRGVWQVTAADPDGLELALRESSPALLAYFERRASDRADVADMLGELIRGEPEEALHAGLRQPRASRGTA